MSDCRKCAEFNWCLENEDCGLFKQKPQTNADRIRAMTDEELAEFLPGRKFGFNCPPEKRKDCPGECVPCWLDWLRREVKE